MRRLTRREFVALGAAGFVVVAGGVAKIIFQPIPPAPSTGSTKDLLLPQSRSGDSKFPASELPLPLWITANEDFYTVRYDELPSVSLTSWSLTVHGMVHETLRLTYDELRALPPVTQMHTLECIGNPVGGNLISNAEWRGVPLRDLLQRAGVDPKAKSVTIGGVDEYFTNVPLSRAMHEHALLAYEMNGQPLPPDHGYPLRVILPGVYGQKQPKWVTGIKVTDADDLGPWEQKGWSNQATIRINSGIKVPVEEKPVPRGDILIAGVAHAGEVGVRAVEVSTDGGKTWHETVLTRGPSPFVWTEWGYWLREAEPGEYHLMVRAIDNQGNRQEVASAGILSGTFPDGTLEIHSVRVQVLDR